jgi:hypothetical protein
MKGKTSCLSLELPIAVNGNSYNATISVHLLANGRVIVGDVFFDDYDQETQCRIIDDLNTAQHLAVGVSRWYLAYQAVIEELVSIRGNI